VTDINAIEVTVTKSAEASGDITVSVGAAKFISNVLEEK